MPQFFSHLPTPVAGCLNAYYRRKRLFQLLRVLFGAFTVYLFLGLVGMHLDRFLFLTTATRVQVLWVAHGATALVAGAGLAWFLLRRPTPRQIAYELESKLPDDAEERYVTLEDLLRRKDEFANPVAQELIGELESAAIRYSQGIRAARLVKDRPLKTLSLVLLAFVVAYGALFVPPSYEFPLMLRRFYLPTANLPKPSFLKMAVKPDHLVIGKGEEVVIQVELSGEVPSLVRWLLKQLGSSPNRCILASGPASVGDFEFAQAAKSELTRLTRNAFLFTRGDVQESFQLQIRCGDAETGAMLVEVVEQPRLLGVKLEATPPEYAGLPQESITDVTRPLRFLPGTKIKISFQASHAVPTRHLRFAHLKEPVEPEWDEATRTGAYEFDLKQKVQLEILVKNEKGFANVERTRIAIGLREDASPTVTLDDPTGDIEKVPAELIPFQGTVEDDLGIQELAFRYVLNPSADSEATPMELPVPLETAKPRSVPLKANFDLEKTGAIPGDVVGVQLRARDSAGTDGLSREILVRVVSFTRGENERRRLVVLRFLAQSLAWIAEEDAASEQPTLSSPFAISAKTYDRILQLAKEKDVVLPPEPSVKSLLDVLEKEHHLTDAPHHKEDARRLYAAIFNACWAPSGKGVVAIKRSDALKPLSERILHRLAQFRTLKNLLWRLYGMGYEAENIRQKLGELSEKGDESHDLNLSLQRRAKLYLKGIQDIGDELIQLGQQAGQPDEARVREFFGEINTAAYYLGRGSVAKRQESCEKIVSLIRSLITELRPTLVPFLEEEVKSRAEMETLYQQCLKQIVAGPPPGNDASAWYSHAAEWLGKDGRMIGRNPFAPVWTRLAAVALTEGIVKAYAASLESREQAEKERIRAATEISSPAGDLLASIQSERESLDALAFHWQMGSVLGLKGITDEEKALEVTLLHAEAEICRKGWDPAIRDSLSGQMQKIAESQLPQEPSRLLAEASLKASFEQMEMHRERFHATARTVFAPTGTDLEALARRFQETDQRLEAAVKSLGSAESENAPEAVKNLLSAMEEEKSGLEMAQEKALLLMLCSDARKEEIVKDELLLLKLRELAAQYVSRADPVIESLRAESERQVGARERATLGSDLQRLGFLHKSAGSMMNSLVKAYGDGSILAEEETKKFIVLKEFERTRRFLGVCSVLSEEQGRSAAARKFIKDFPETAPAFLRFHASRAARARDSLQEARKVLEKGPTQTGEFARHIQDSLKEIQAFREALARSGGSEAQATLVPRLEGFEDRLKRLTPATQTLSAQQIQQLRFALGETMTEAEKLLAELLQEDEEESEALIEFRGGPEGIWDKEHRYQAEKSRQRLVGQARYARQGVVDGIFQAFEDQPETAALEHGLAWSNFLYRLVRSDLAGRVGTRAPKMAEEVAADPHLKFLREELEKARQVKQLKNYGAPTREYLDSVGDFLRY